jgi:hypothetical protein
MEEKKSLNRPREREKSKISARGFIMRLRNFKMFSQQALVPFFEEGPVDKDEEKTSFVRLSVYLASSIVIIQIVPPLACLVTVRNLFLAH